MIQSKEEFARIWKKESNQLTQLDYFIYLLINDLSVLLQNEYFDHNSEIKKYQLNSEQTDELVVQLGDGLQFFFEQICYGKGCSLGCPHKLDAPFSKREDKLRENIIKEEFAGSAKLCKSREDCLRHDLMNYVIKDHLIDFLNYSMNIECTEDDPALIDMAEYIEGVIMCFTFEKGPNLLKKPFTLAI